MPYSSRIVRRNMNPAGRYRRRRYRRYRPRQISWAQVARKAWSGVKMLKGIVNAEKKTFDRDCSNLPDTTGSIQCLTDIAQGDDYNGREGRSILAKSLELFGNLNVGANNTDTFCRFIVFIDTNLQDSGTLPAVTDYLTSASQAALRNPNPNFMKRFVTLMDTTVCVDEYNPNKQWRFFKKLNHHIKFDGTAAADASQGAILLLTISNMTGAGNTPTSALRSRMRYYDN